MRKGKTDTNSLSAFATYRGCSPSAVSKALRTGRLVASVVRDAGGNVTIPDFAAASREWDLRTRTKLGAEAAAKFDAGAAEYRTRLEAIRARKWMARAELIEIELEERRSSLVPVAELARAIPAMFRRVRARLLRTTAELAKRAPALTAAQLAMYEQLVTEATEDIDERAVSALLERLQGRQS